MKIGLCYWERFSPPAKFYISHPFLSGTPQCWKEAARRQLHAKHRTSTKCIHISAFFLPQEGHSPFHLLFVPSIKYVVRPEKVKTLSWPVFLHLKLVTLRFVVYKKREIFLFSLSTGHKNSASPKKPSKVNFNFPIVFFLILLIL